VGRKVAFRSAKGRVGSSADCTQEIGLVLRILATIVLVITGAAIGFGGVTLFYYFYRQGGEIGALKDWANDAVLATIVGATIGGFLGAALPTRARHE
jgi:hypothetical protein